MSKLLAFLRRDVAIEASYRLAFAVQALAALASVAAYHFLARFVGGHVPGLEAYGGDYFAFVLVGVALHEYLATSLDAFSRSVREAQLAGTLEALLSTQTALPTIVLCSAAYPLLSTTVTVALYLALGAGLFGMPLAGASWLMAGLVLALAIAAFSALGILSAAFILVFKRGSPVAWLVAALSWLLGGVLYPVAVLPAWLRLPAALLPITHAIEGMRAALLQGGPWSAVGPSLLTLAIFAGLLLPLSLLVFHGATRWTRRAGTLAQY